MDGSCCFYPLSYQLVCLKSEGISRKLSSCLLLSHQYQGKREMLFFSLLQPMEVVFLFCFSALGSSLMGTAVASLPPASLELSYLTWNLTISLAATACLTPVSLLCVMCYCILLNDKWASEGRYCQYHLSPLNTHRHNLLSTCVVLNRGDMMQ